MRVLLYADRPANLGGIETHIADLALALHHMGWHVTVAFGQIISPCLFTQVVDAGIDVTQMTPEDVLQRAQSSDYDIIHAHSYGAARAAYRTHLETGLPVVVTVHGPDQRVPCPPTPGVSIVCVSQEIALPLQSYYRQRLTVIENGVDLKRFKPDGSDANAPAGHRSGTSVMKIKYLGRVGPSKRPGLIALYDALKFRDDVELTFLSNWAPNNSYRPSFQVEKDLNGADLVFSTGRGVREAMALGAAVGVLGVHWDGLVTPQTVDLLRWTNFSGRACREQPSVKAIAYTVRELLFQPGRLTELKQFSRRYAEHHFDLQITVEQLIQVYRRVMSEVS